MINRWNPYRELENIRDQMNRLFYERYGTEPPEIEEGPRIRVDMYETDTHLIVAAAIPGVKPQDLEITITGNRLNIRGEMRPEPDRENAAILLQERKYGRFQRAIQLQSGVDTDDISANFEDGILKISLAKSEQSKPRQISVRSQHK